MAFYSKMALDIRVARNRRPWSYRDRYIPAIRPYDLLTGIRKHIESTEMMIYKGAYVDLIGFNRI